MSCNLVCNDLLSDHKYIADEPIERKTKRKEDSGYWDNNRHEVEKESAHHFLIWHSRATRGTLFESLHEWFFWLWRIMICLERKSNLDELSQSKNDSSSNTKRSTYWEQIYSQEHLINRWKWKISKELIEIVSIRSVMNTDEEKINRWEKRKLNKNRETCSKRAHIFFLPKFHHLEAKLLLIIFIFFFKCCDLWLEFLRSTRCHHRCVLWHKNDKSH